VEQLGLGIGTMMRRLGREKITLGRDCRPSSDAFRDAIVAGMSATGLSVIDIGVVPTPLLYTRSTSSRATAGDDYSHNPPEYNGFKTCVGHDSVYGEQIQKYTKSSNPGISLGEGQGFNGGRDLTYRKYVLDQIRLPRRVRVALDCGNGTGSLLAPDIVSGIGLRGDPALCNMDGTFPNHHPDPTVVENLADLRNAVKTAAGTGNRVRWRRGPHRSHRRQRGHHLGRYAAGLVCPEILKHKPGATFISESSAR
jgi:phosphomannomutase/phosphoglucomutase